MWLRLKASNETVFIGLPQLTIILSGVITARIKGRKSMFSIPPFLHIYGMPRDLGSFGPPGHWLGIQWKIKEAGQDTVICKIIKNLARLKMPSKFRGQIDPIWPGTALAGR
jgi:hypothetical protein